MLQNIEKYNWWTKDKENISLDAKIGYIMTSGSLDELFMMIKDLQLDVLKKAFEKIQNDTYKLKQRRKKAILSLFDFKKQGKI